MAGTGYRTPRTALGSVCLLLSHPLWQEGHKIKRFVVGSDLSLFREVLLISRTIHQLMSGEWRHSKRKINVFKSQVCRLEHSSWLGFEESSP